MKGALKQMNDVSSHDLSTAVSRLRTANDAISVLVSALTSQVTARTLNQQSCDYCGERYPAPGPIAWASHHCKVVTATEHIISECVQHLLRERTIAKNEVERYLRNDVMFLRPAM